MSHNYSKMPDDEDMPRFEPTVPLGLDDFTAGLGFTTGTSSSSQCESGNVTDSSSAKEQSPPIVEDDDSSDDESEEIVQEQSSTVPQEIPIENHILCDPPVEPSKTGLTKAVETLVSSFEGKNLLYTLIGDNKIYSNKDFPIKNVNQSLIDQVFEGCTSKFLGTKSDKVTVTQCEPIPCEEVQKQYGNQKLPVERKQQTNTGKGKKQRQRAQNKKVQKPKVQQPKIEQPKVSQPKVEQSKVQRPKVEQPRVQQPKVQNKRAPVKKKGKQAQNQKRFKR